MTVQRIDTDSEPCKKYAIIDAVKQYFGEDKVLNVATFGTVSSKTAIERACRGLGISDDIAGYLKSLIPVNRGKIADLKECLYGKDKIKGFKAEFDKYDNLEECAVGICGVICQRGVHAAGLCISNEPYTDYLGAMKAPNGCMCTSFNLWDSEAVSLVKFDLLTVEALQKMHKAMDAMIEDGVIEWQGSVRATYNKYFHPDVIDYTTPEMWDSITKMSSIFQWETPIGIKAINQIKPKTVMDLSAGNSLIRLMPEGRDETPLETYVRYKEHPEQWEQEATEYGLNEDEKQVVREYCGDSYYLADCQEKIMRLSQDKRVAGYTLKESNKLRKSIAKKDAKLQAESKTQFFEWGKKCGTREIFLKYVWEVLFGASFGYSFSSIHSYVYSIIALQELNMYYHYNPVYWNVGCLQSESSADNEGSGGNIDYGKIAKAIYKMRSYGIDVKAPNINHSNLDFTADTEHNHILYGLAGISGINSEIAQQIISNRPYDSFADFYKKNSYAGSLVTNSKFIQLIKAGCFDDFSKNRVRIMKEYIMISTPKPTNLTMQNMSAIKSVMALPKTIFAPYNFFKYVCSKPFLYGMHPKFKSKKIYWLDDKAMTYFANNCRSSLKENVDYWEENDKTVVVDKSLEKLLSPSFDAVKEYINTKEFIEDYYKASLKKKFNEMFPNQDQNHWSFDSCSYYSQEHELSKVNLQDYNVECFSELPTTPIFIERNFRGRTWKQYELYAIAGTLIDRDDTHNFITILTVDDEVVTCKMTQGVYAFYKQQLSVFDENGKKTVTDPSWLARGNLLILSGYRNDDGFVCKKYTNSIFQHQVQKINRINDDGSLDIMTERNEN